MTVAEAVREAAARLEQAGCPSARADAEHLVAHVVGASRTGVYADGGRPLTRAQAETLAALVNRRAAREPLAYVLGEWGFRRLTLKVDARVLVPRPETEILVERCLVRIRGLDEPRVLDVGVGSGAIALALADEHPGARVVAFDNSPEALLVARSNAEAAGLLHRVTLLEGDLADGLGPDRYDLVVSNPPYVEPDEIEALEPEVRDWEPRHALVGSGVTEALAESARDALRDGGWLVVEIADGKARAVADLFERLGYRRVATTRDLAGRERVVEGQWRV